MSRYFFFLVLLIAPVMATWNNTHFFYLCSWRHLISGVLLGFLGYTFGALFSLLARQGKAQIIAISLETAIQNGGIAFIVLNLTFESPFSDMGQLPILSFFFFSTGPIMFVVYATYLLVKFIKKQIGFKQLPQEEVEPQKEEEESKEN